MLTSGTTAVVVLSVLLIIFIVLFTLAMTCVIPSSCVGDELEYSTDVINAKFRGDESKGMVVRITTAKDFTPNSMIYCQLGLLELDETHIFTTYPFKLQLTDGAAVVTDEASMYVIIRYQITSIYWNGINFEVLMNKNNTNEGVGPYMANRVANPIAWSNQYFEDLTL